MSLLKNLSGTSEEIVEYLHNHPDFFVAHPEVLSGLVIPHGLGKNISSLLEYQVFRLRQQITEMQNAAREMEACSNSGRNFAATIHALSLELLACSTPEELYGVLYKDLKPHYSADKLLLYIFSKSGISKNHSGLHFMNTNVKLRFMFAEIFDRNKPLCGSLQEEHLTELFGNDTDLIKSTVLLPMNHPDWQGLLVLGSPETNRYSHGFELDLLVYLKDIVYFMIHNFIALANIPDQ